MAKLYKPKVAKPKLIIPAACYTPSDRTIEYIANFDRMNGLRPSPYTWRGMLINGGAK